MKNNLLEYIILYLLVTCAALVIATLARMSVVSLGVDSFTAFIVFLVVLAIEIAIYLSIHVVLQELMLPWIEKGLYKIPYFRNKIEKRQILFIEEEEVLSVSEQVSLDEIRQEQQQDKAQAQEEKRDVAIDYTRKSFALYLSDKDLDILCRNIRIYIDKLDANHLLSVKVKELTAIDLRHFGWNIWNYFKPRNQMDIAHFLKNVFPDIFKNTEVESIKPHLKDDELKGVIKIKYSLL